MKLNIIDFETRVKLFGIRVLADAAIDKVFLDGAQNVEELAKLNAPWTDRTGNARRTLSGLVKFETFGKKYLSLAGMMEYSPRLEIFYDCKYSILFPTILENYKGILNDVVAGVKGVKV